MVPVMPNSLFWYIQCKLDYICHRDTSSMLYRVRLRALLDDRATQVYKIGSLLEKIMKLRKAGVSVAAWPWS